MRLRAAQSILVLFLLGGCAYPPVPEPAYTCMEYYASNPLDPYAAATLWVCFDRQNRMVKADPFYSSVDIDGNKVRCFDELNHVVDMEALLYED